ncbi:MAG: 8-amino-7-oxononanoate synthase [Planctomycetes bacterium]|nr:8-amino-7-oxononanoate synthase [Planctomycetota bacterium]
MKDIWRQMAEELDELGAAGLLRACRGVESADPPRLVIDGRPVVCLCSNDYLGLACDESVKAAAIEAINKWGVGAGASRLISGTTNLHQQLEDRLAEFKKTEAAIVTSTGWMANHVAIHALAGPGDLIVSDKLNHASIIDAAISSGARVRTFPHRQAARAGKILAEHRAEYKRCLIVTDSLFSMDGDIAPMGELAELKKKFNCQLLIDEAHATGVLGKCGRGAAEMLGVEDGVDAVVGTLSKALGGLGGFVAGPKVLIDTIVNKGRPFIYTTALPASLCAAGLKALEIIQTQPARRQKLLSLADRMRQGLAGLGLDCGDSASQIIPIILGGQEKTMRVSQALLEAGFFVAAIRPPTVPKGACRLRVSLSAMHDESIVDSFLNTLARCLKKLHG